MKALLLLILSTLPLPAEPPKIGYVNIATIFESYDATLESKEDFRSDREEVIKGTRFESLREANRELKELAARVRDEEISPENREIAAEKFNNLSLEYQALMLDFENYLKAEQRRQSLEQLKRAEELLVVIRAEIELLSKNKDYDLVFEIGGLTSSQLSPILYIRDGIDLTQIVLARLNDKFNRPEPTDF
ncbi:MAG: OmpH family outer membrane protein [Verrucomicrobiota bacterium]